MDWGRLQIEQSTQASHARVEQLAREQLQMRLPDPREIRVVGP
jgi:cell division protein FtsL